MRFLKVNNQLTELTRTLTLVALPEIRIRSIGYLLMLVTCTYTQALAQAPSKPAVMLPLSITILYFDQSSPLLRPNVKSTLDSLARLLMDQPALVATVTGYTDDIGKRELNLVLAEKRTKAVETHLKQRGVPASQISTHWEGPDKDVSLNDPKAIKTIGRRVVVQLNK